MGPRTTSAAIRPTYPRYNPYGNGPVSRLKSTKQRTNNKTAPAAVAITVAVPLRPAVAAARFGCWLWKASKSRPASSLIKTSISAIRRRWSSLAIACWIVVRTIQRTAEGVRINTAIRDSMGNESVAATAAAMNPTEAGSRRSRAERRKRRRAFRLRYSSTNTSMHSRFDSVSGDLIPFAYHHR